MQRQTVKRAEIALVPCEVSGVPISRRMSACGMVAVMGGVSQSRMAVRMLGAPVLAARALRRSLLAVCPDGAQQRAVLTAWASGSLPRSALVGLGLAVFVAAAVVVAPMPQAFAQTTSAAPAPSVTYSDWPVLVNPFESTGGEGVMIDGYAPIVDGNLCRTDFTATPPGGPVYRNEVAWTAVAVQGGILCTNGQWRAKDGSANGTTPFQVFIKDGVVRRMP